MSYKKLFIDLCFLINLCICKQYNNYTLYRGIPVNSTQLDFFNNLSEIYDVNFWRSPGSLYMPIDFVIRPEDKQSFLTLAEQYGIYLTTIIPDVQKSFDLQTVKSYVRRKMETFDWMHYFRLDDIYNWLRDLSRAYPTVMQLEYIGLSHEHRKIMAVKITLKGSNKRSKVIVEGGIHAREWISPAFVTYMIDQILHAPYSNDTALKEIALTYEWFFVPVMNPDGYEYTHTQDRMWRKNRNYDHYAVDLNRNFGIRFGSVGVSFNKASETYCGPQAFSEKESSAMADFVRRNSGDLEYYLAFHSYGQYIIIPYAYSKQHLDNFKEVKEMADQAGIAIAAKFKTTYNIGTAYDTVGYVTSGVSGCWVKKNFRVPYVFTFELRDNGYHGFALPPSSILPTCLETMDGLVSLLKPRTKRHRKLIGFRDRGERTVFGKIVLLCNFILFIILRFD
nr:M14 metal carboxypeptidase 5 [Antheraea yamamai]